MRAMSILLVLAGIGVGAATAYIASPRAALDPMPVPANGEFASGPQVGTKLPGTFDALHINGADAGDECCMLCKYGNDPVVMVFASRSSDGLAELVRRLDKAAAGAKGAGACVVVTDTSDAAKTELKKLADKNDIKHVVLSVIDPTKLKRYTLHPDAEATVLLYSKQVVRANRAFKAGELSEKAAAELAEQAVKHYAGE
jgi:hypothetical protein